MASSKVLAPVVSSVVAATMIFSTVAYVSYLNGSGNSDKSSAKANQQQVTILRTGTGDLPIIAAPEANAGLVMIPFVGAVLAFSSLHLFRAKTAKNKAI
jgi:hypothetical protein